MTKEKGLAWKIDGEVDKRVVSSDAIKDIQEKYHLTEHAATILAEEIEMAMLPGIGWTDDKEPERSKKKAQSIVKATKAELAKSQRTLRQAVEDMSSIYFVDPECRSPTEAPGYSFKQELKQAAEDVTKCNETLRELLKPHNKVVYLNPSNKQHVSDYRRIRICDAAFAAWIASGKKVSFTWDDARTERNGQIVDLINDLATHLTEPFRRISGNTIIADWKRSPLNPGS